MTPPPVTATSTASARATAPTRAAPTPAEKEPVRRPAAPADYSPILGADPNTSPAIEPQVAVVALPFGRNPLTPREKSGVAVPVLTQAAAKDALAGQIYTATIQSLRDGKFNLQFHYNTDRDGRITEYRVLLVSEGHCETVASYKKGGKPEQADSPAAKAAIAYLQTLLEGSASGLGPLSLERGTGYFDLPTANALYNFLSARKEPFRLNPEQERAAITRRLVELQKMESRLRMTLASDRDSDFKHRVMREALDKYARLAEHAQNILDQLPQGVQPELTGLCREVVDFCEGEMGRLLADLMGAYVQIDFRRLGKRMRAYLEAAAKNSPKTAEHLRELNGMLISLGDTLRSYAETLPGRAAVGKAAQDLRMTAQPAVDVPLKDLLDSLLENYHEPDLDANADLSLMRPEEMQDLTDFGDKNLEGEEGVRRRHAQAWKIFEAIETDPSARESREVIISFLYDAFRSRREIPIGELFSRFQGVVRRAGGNLEYLGKYIYERNRLSQEALSEEAIADRTEDMGEDTDDSSEALDDVCGEENTKCKGAVKNLFYMLYLRIEEHNLWARTAEGRGFGAREIKFAEVARFLREKLLPELKIPTDPQAQKFYEIGMKRVARLLYTNLASTSDAESARFEIAGSAERELTQNELKKPGPRVSFENVLSVTPRVLELLETRYGELSIHPRAVRRDGRYFLISVRGAAHEISETLVQTGAVAVETQAGAAGIVMEREPVDFLLKEKLAVLKLAAAGREPISGGARLSESGETTAALEAMDLRALLKVFGKGKFYFKPGTMDVLPDEAGVLRKLRRNHELYGERERFLLERLVKMSSDRYFTKAELDELRGLAKALAAKRPGNLRPGEVRALDALVKKLEAALPQVMQKPGLEGAPKAALEKLARYLQRFNLVITDATLTNEVPPESMLNKIPLDEQKAFTECYAEGVRALNIIHWQLVVLASKYPPEEIEEMGLAFFGTYFKKLFHAMSTSISMPSAQSALVVGLPEEEIIKINLLLFPEKARELAQVQARLDAVDKDIKAQLNYDGKTEKFGVRDAQKLYIALAGNDKLGVKGLKQELEGVIAELKASGRYKANEEDEDEPGLEMPLTAYVRLLEEFKRGLDDLLANLQGGYEDPLQLIYAADGIHAALIRLRQDLKSTPVPAEDNKPGWGFLGRLLAKAEEGEKLFREKILPARRKYADKIKERTALEIAQGNLFTFINEDTFDGDKFKRLEKLFADGLLGESAWAEVCDWLSRQFLAEQAEMLGREGVIHEKPGEILRRFFYEQRGVIRLSSTLPAPGEPEEATMAKIALSKFFERLPREQSLHLLSTVPILALSSRGMFSSPFTVGLTALPGRATDLDKIYYGPDNLQELRQWGNSPTRMAWFNFLSWMTFASDTAPDMVISSQFHLLLSRSRRGSEYLRRKLSRFDGKNFSLQKVDYSDIPEMLAYLRNEVLPQVKSNSRLRARLQYLVRTGRISGFWVKDPENWAGLKDIEALGKKKGSFELYSAKHYKIGREKMLAILIEDLSRVTGEINKARAAEDPENTPLGYLDLAERERELHPQSADPSDPKNMEPRRKLKVVRFGAELKRGASRTAWWNLPTDIADWTDTHFLYLSQDLERATRDWEIFAASSQNLAEEALKGWGSGWVKFALLMHNNITMGWPNIADGVGTTLKEATLAAAGNGDWKQVLDAVKQLRDGVAETAGGFFVFETLSVIFLGEVIADIENRQYGKALGKLHYIYTQMLKDAIPQQIELIKIAIANDKIRIVDGKIMLDQGWFKAQLGSLLTSPKRVHDHFARGEGGLGVKAVYWTTVGIPYEIGASLSGASNPVTQLVYRWKLRGSELAITVRASQFEAGGSTGGSAPAPSRWVEVAEIKDGVLRWLPDKIHAGKKVLNDSLGNRVRRVFASGKTKTAGAAPVPQSALRGYVGALEGSAARMGDGFNSRLAADANRPVSIGAADFSLDAVGDLARLQALAESQAQIAESQISRAASDPNSEFTIELWRTKGEKGAPKGGLTLDRATFLELASCAKNKDEAGFRKAIERFNARNQQKYAFTSGNYAELYQAFAGYGGALARLESAGAVANVDALIDSARRAEEVKRQGLLAILEEIGKGKGLFSEYSFTLKDGKTVKVKGWQLKRILFGGAIPGLLQEEAMQVAQAFRTRFDMHQIGAKLKHIERYLKRFTAQQLFEGFGIEVNDPARFEKVPKAKLAKMLEKWAVEGGVNRIIVDPSVGAGDKQLIYKIDGLLKAFPMTEKGTRVIRVEADERGRIVVKEIKLKPGEALSDISFELNPERIRVLKLSRGMLAKNFAVDSVKSIPAALFLSGVLAIGRRVVTGQSFKDPRVRKEAAIEIAIGTGIGAAFMGLDKTFQLLGYRPAASMGAAGGLIGLGIGTYSQWDRVKRIADGHGWTAARGLFNIGESAVSGAAGGATFAWVTAESGGLMIVPAMLASTAVSMGIEGTVNQICDGLGATAWADGKEHQANFGDHGIALEIRGEERNRAIDRFANFNLAPTGEAASNLEAMGAALKNGPFMADLKASGIRQISAGTSSDLNVKIFPRLVGLALQFKEKFGAGQNGIMINVSKPAIIAFAEGRVARYSITISNGKNKIIVPMDIILEGDPVKVAQRLWLDKRAGDVRLIDLAALNISIPYSALGGYPQLKQDLENLIEMSEVAGGSLESQVNNTLGGSRDQNYFDAAGERIGRRRGYLSSAEAGTLLSQVLGKDEVREALGAVSDAAGMTSVSDPIEVIAARLAQLNQRLFSIEQGHGSAVIRKDASRFDPDVALIQQALFKLGLLPEELANGFYSAATVLALKDFAEAANIHEYDGKEIDNRILVYLLTALAAASKGDNWHNAVTKAPAELWILEAQRSAQTYWTEVLKMYGAKNLYYSEDLEIDLRNWKDPRTEGLNTALFAIFNHYNDVSKGRPAVVINPRLQKRFDEIRIIGRGFGSRNSEVYKIQLRDAATGKKIEWHVEITGSFANLLKSSDGYRDNSRSAEEIARLTSF